MFLQYFFSYGSSVISLIFVGHLGTREMSSAVLGTSFMNVSGFALLTGLSSALETLCGQVKPSTPAPFPFLPRLFGNRMVESTLHKLKLLAASAAVQYPDPSHASEQPLLLCRLTEPGSTSLWAWHFRRAPSSAACSFWRCSQSGCALNQSWWRWVCGGNLLVC